MMQASQAVTYQILVEGSPDPFWYESLGGLEISVLRDAGQPVITLLKGQLADQSALQGVLDTLFLLHLRLLRVEWMRAES